jgi:hypothetical protein
VKGRKRQKITTEVTEDAEEEFSNGEETTKKREGLEAKKEAVKISLAAPRLVTA